ncbi:MAG TPA: type II toxin-antitoxin system RelE/ParE family toxin [Desulfobacteria bacterium]|nr:type II toxin-antitoxin system RelE/ParE family toxin [Desulfobacteria bacterium]
MNSGRYWLTGSAEKDLADIAKYTLETWGEEQLEIYRHRLEERLDLLIGFPELGNNHPMLRSDFRYVVEGKHYIFYRRVGDDIEVLRFLHCRSDIISKLSAYL